MASTEPPQPPYILLFQEAAPEAEPMVISVDERPALPLFDSIQKAEAFVSSSDFGSGWSPVELSGVGLITVLESCRGAVDYVAINPPPASESGMKVRMGDLGELIEALQTNPEDDLFGLGGLNRN